MAKMRKTTVVVYVDQMERWFRMVFWASVLNGIISFALFIAAALVFICHLTAGKSGEGNAAAVCTETGAVTRVDGDRTMGASQVGEGEVVVGSIKTDGKHGKRDASDVTYHQIGGAAASVVNAINGCARPFPLTQSLIGLH